MASATASRSNSGRPSDSGPIEKAKRKTVTAACQNCRKRRAKCDAQRPCANCQRRHEECVYDVRENETPRQAAKRKHNEVSQTASEYEDLWRVVKTKSDQEAGELFGKIRSGESLEAVLRHAKYSSPGSGARVVSTHERRLKEDFLVQLIRSTAPLGDVVRLATQCLSTGSRVSLPDREAFVSLRDTIIDIEVLSGLVRRANPGQRVPQQPTGGDDEIWFKVADGTHDGPLYWVPSDPWTTVTSSDATVSHLVTVFLSYHNFAFRHVEEDLFLRDMRSRKLSSRYCSPFLVNSILALAATESEIDDAYSVPGERLARGSHFRSAAVQLWEEDGSDSITNIQGLTILAQANSYSGRDKLAISLVFTAAQMSARIPVPASWPTMGSKQQDYVRARQGAAWCSAFQEAGYVSQLLQPTSTLISRVSDLPDPKLAFNDTLRYWIGYPLRQEPLPLRANLLFHATCDMTRFITEIIELVLSEKPKDLEFRKEASSLATRLELWYAKLPEALRHRKPMPAPIFGIHACYVSVSMLLYNQVGEALYPPAAIQGEDDSSAGLNDGLSLQELTTKNLGYAYSAATTTRDWREAYGLKLMDAWGVMQATSASFILLKEMKHTGSAFTVDTLLYPDPITNTNEAFEECFRLLLALGMQLLLPRAIARMIYQSSRMMKVRLPENVVRMLAVIADSAWKPSDIENLSSVMPNWTLADGSRHAAASYSVEDVLRSWDKLEITDSSSTEHDDQDAGASSADAEQGP